MRRTSIIFIALRECVVLLASMVLTASVAYLISDGRPRPKMMPFANPLVALFVPIFICILRAGFVRGPSKHVSKLRAILFQISIAFALIFLLLFEIGVGLFVDGVGIPLDAWLIVIALGLAYVLFFCLAHTIDPYHESPLIRNPFAGDDGE